MRFTALIWAALMLAACGSRNDTGDMLRTRTVTFPDGFTVVAEAVSNPTDMMRGMMFRDSLAVGRGMLFLHGKPGPYSYWMYQVRIPLDLIWMDRNGAIVELAAGAQPCPGPASSCPHYGGNVPSSMVLEIGGGQAAKHGLKIGDRLRIQ